MSKIVILVHEHPNETPITRTRATQVKRILEKPPYNHQVEIETFHNPIQPHKFANELSRAKSEKEAIAILDAHLKQRVGGSATEQFLHAEAAKRPGAHLFSFHGCVIPTRAIPLANSVSAPKADWFTSNELMFSHKTTASSFVAHDLVDGRVAAIVENSYHALPAGKAYENSLKRIRKCEEFFEAWKRISPPKDREERMERSDMLSLLRNYTMTTPRKLYPVLRKVEHAQALADKMHELIVQAEGK